MKKIYNFSVEVDIQEKKKGFASKIIEDVRKASEELDATNKVNLATSKLHKAILQEFVDAVNYELEELGLAFSEVKVAQMWRNNYYISQSSLNLKASDRTIFLSISPQDSQVDFSRYMTFCGEYSLVAQIGESGTIKILNKENPMEDLFRRMESVLKIEYNAQLSKQK